MNRCPRCPWSARRTTAGRPRGNRIRVRDGPPRTGRGDHDDRLTTLGSRAAEAGRGSLWAPGRGVLVRFAAGSFGEHHARPVSSGARAIAARCCWPTESFGRGGLSRSRGDLRRSPRRTRGCRVSCPAGRSRAAARCSRAVERRQGGFVKKNWKTKSRSSPGRQVASGRWVELRDVDAVDEHVRRSAVGRARPGSALSAGTADPDGPITP